MSLSEVCFFVHELKLPIHLVYDLKHHLPGLQGARQQIQNQTVEKVCSLLSTTGWQLYNTAAWYTESKKMFYRCGPYRPTAKVLIRAPFDTPYMSLFGVVFPDGDYFKLGCSNDFFYFETGYMYPELDLEWQYHFPVAGKSISNSNSNWFLKLEEKLTTFSDWSTRIPLDEEDQ